MSFERKQIVREAFNLLDKSGDGVVTVEDILQNYDFSFHPSVSNGSITSDEAATEMLSCFESTGDVDGKVTWSEFLDYYKGISLSIDDDDYFELMMRNAWHLSGGTGWSENTSCKRVLVTHSDGSDEIVEVKNDLGLNYRDMNEVRRRLERQGVQDIRKIQL
jgi:calcyphosin